MENIITIIFVIIISCWVLTFIQGTRMFYIFRKKYPEIAKNKISNAFEPYADPDKLFFLFKKENLPLLKKDKQVWRLRQQTKILFTLSIGAPLLIAFLSIFIFLSQ
jgi:hypothetical protein